MVLSLQIDRSHPRWAPEPSLWVEALGGLALAPSLRSGAERSCDQFDCSNDGLALGGLVGLRGGYELPIRIAFELSAGYFGIQKSFSRTIHERFGGPKHDLYASTYELRDKIRILGPFAAAGVSYRRPLGTRFSIAAAVSIGVLYLASRDRIDGTGSAGGQTLDVYVIGSDELRRSGNLFAMPELRIGANFGRVEVGLGLAAGLFLLDGPKYPTSDLTTGAECGTAPLDTIQCAPGEDAVREERAYGRFFAAMPMARVRYTF